jgi:hypothetical protein
MMSAISSSVKPSFFTAHPSCLGMFAEVSLLDERDGLEASDDL